MKKIYINLSTVACLLFLTNFLFGQKSFFTDVVETTVKNAGNKRVIIPSKYRTLQLDTEAALAFFHSLPNEEKILQDRNAAPIIELPMPSGNMAKFRVWKSGDIAPEFVTALPNLITMTGQGIDDPTATIKMDWTEFGFHGMVLSAITGSYFIDPYDQQTTINYISYFKADFKKKQPYTELPIKNFGKKINNLQRPDNVQGGPCVGTQLRRYKLAVACTHQYAQAATGLAAPTKLQTLAKIVTSVTRVNGVYEKEMSIRLVLIPNDTAVIFPVAAGDPFAGNDVPGTLLAESQTVIDSVIGNANYDIGHTFSTGGGGVAFRGVVCTTGEKASGITGSPNPVGDPYDIDYVAHEMGHQFGASHPFNSVNDACGGNGSNATNAEPGSGSTIMAYAGICTPDNLQNNSDPQFHGVSFDEISSYSINSSGNGCATILATGNNPPVVNAGSNYSIPISTPFILTGSATDPNVGDVLTYSWEQMNVGGPFGAPASPSGDAPIFRSFAPVSTPTRYFPKLSSVINNTTTLGELLPTYGRVLKFRLTARDNKAAGGGVCYGENQVTVVGTSGPFTVTAPNATGISWTVGDFQTITWNPSGTSLAPISCANVSLQLSTDGGNTFPITLIPSTPNDGNEEITVPNNVGTQARVRAMAVGNVFYDMSNNNFAIAAASTPTFSFNSPALVSVCAASSGVAPLKTATFNGFSTIINLTASLNPAGTTVTFGSTTLAPGASTTVTLNNTNSLAPGTYTIRVTGTAGAVTKTRDISFLIGAGGNPPTTLSVPTNNSFGVDIKPSFNWSTVTGAIGYTLEISKDTTFSTLRLSIPSITSLPYFLTTSLGEDSVYYWRVKTTNNCGVGTSTNYSKFKTRLNTCRISNDVPKIISSVGTPTITSTLVVPAGLGVVITDLNVVGLVGSHTYVSDLTFTLKSPAGTVVTLFNNLCGQNQYQDFNLNLDDQSATTVFPCPPTGGVTVKPTNLLSAFNGQNSTGIWTLTVSDNQSDDGGSLDGWGLSINTNSTNCTYINNPLPITYTFTGNGNWNVATNWSSNTVPPTTLPSGASIIIDHAVGGQCLLNVTQNIAAGASITVVSGKNILIPGALNIQ